MSPFQEWVVQTVEFIGLLVVVGACILSLVYWVGKAMKESRPPRSARPPSPHDASFNGGKNPR